MPVCESARVISHAYFPHLPNACLPISEKEPSKYSLHFNSSKMLVSVIHMLTNKDPIENSHPALLKPLGRNNMPEPTKPLIKVKKTAELLNFGASSLTIAFLI